MILSSQAGLLMMEQPYPTTGQGGGSGVQSVAMDAIVTFDNGTGALTATKFNAGVHGAAAFKNWTEFHNGAALSNTDTVIENHAVELPFEISVAGVQYDGSESSGLKFDFAAAPTSYDAYQLGVSGVDNIVTMYVIQSNVVLSSDNYFNDIIAHLAANYTIGQMQARFGGDTRVICAHSEGSLGVEIPFTTGDWLLVTVFHNSTGGAGNVLVHKLSGAGAAKTLGDVLGHSVSNHDAGAAGDLVQITLQTYLRLALAPSTGNIKIKLIAFNQSNPVFPPYTIPVVPLPSTVSATPTDPAVLTWNGHSCQIFDIQRNKNSAGFANLSLLYNTTGTDSYSDSDVIVGDVVQYRIRTVIGSQKSAWVTSSPVTVAPFSPAAGNVLWLKADALVLANNDPVTTWTDSSGSGNHFTQATAGAKPTFKTGVLNGLPVIRGDGGDHLAHSGAVTGNEQYTLLIVQKKSATAGTISFYNGNSGANGYGYYQDGSDLRNVFFGGAAVKVDGAPSATDFEAVVSTWNGTTSRMWVNGTEVELTDPATGMAGVPSGDTTVFGLAGTNQWNGDIAEIMLWDNNIAALSRQAAVDYVGSKYALTIVHDDL
jgi:hypothetical protein